MMIFDEKYSYSTHSPQPQITVEPVIITYGRSRSCITIFAAFIVLLVFIIGISLIGLAIFTDGFKFLSGNTKCQKIPSSPLGTPPTITDLQNLPAMIPPQRILTIPQNICLTPDCVKLSSNILTNMNAKMSPCEDFYEFSCGSYIMSKPVPDSDRKASAFIETKMRLNMEFKELLEDFSRDEKSDSAKLVYIYYDSCMDDQAQDTLDLMPLFSLVSSLGGWSLLQNAKFDEKDFFWETLEGQMHLFGVDGLIGMTVRTDPLNENGGGVLTLHAPRLLLEHRHLYSDDFEKNVFLQQYKIYMVDLLQLLGADPEGIEPQLKEIIDFEQSLANITNPYSKQKSTIPLRELKERLYRIEWKLFLNTDLRLLLSPIDDDTVIEVHDADYFRKLEKLLKMTETRTLKNYLMWKVIASYNTYLPQRYRVPYENLESALYGTTVRPLWAECINEVKKRLSIPLAVLYSKKYQNEEKLNKVGEVLGDLKSSLEQNILNADWMDEGTRAMALRKLKNLHLTIDISKNSPNESMVLLPYSGLRLAGNAYFENSLALRKALKRSSLKRLHVSIKAPWYKLLTDLEAFHRYTSNEIVFPSGLLHFPFFVMNAPKYVNYGALGMIMGQEITQSFDDLGANFDDNGELRVWWQPDTRNFFESKKQCFIAQYDSKTNPFTDKKLDGRKTLRENIADNGGLRAAFNAYNLRTMHDPERQQLPALTNFTDHQLFFLAFANAWCESHKITPAHQFSDTENTALNMFRGEWPPGSPDLNPLDYAIWTILEKKACAKPHPTVESLKRALVKAWDEISVDTLRKIVDDFPKRLKACVEADGGHFE
uniref:Uncharacterized protein n=1 Tax=Acrobeloides nanus TaxID=290746 RepID=A0A914D5C5_9BILA